MAITTIRSTDNPVKDDRPAFRSHTAAPTPNAPMTPGTGPSVGWSKVSRASIRRTPSTNANSGGAGPPPPSSGRHSSVSTAGSAGGADSSASAGSSGAPYSGDQLSTWSRAGSNRYSSDMDAHGTGDL